MSDQRITITEVSSGGSGRGVSYYLNAAACPRKARLDAELVEAGPRPLYPDSAATIGTLFHKLCEVYYGQKTRDIVLELDDLRLRGDIAEAYRLFAGYTKVFACDEWEVISTEELVPRDEVDADAIRVSFGVELTARLDLVVRVREEDIPRLIRTRPGLEGIEPGVYLVDHKTQGARGSQDAMKYGMSAQFVAYQMMWNLLHPEEPCSGMIANIVVKHKKLDANSFYSLLVPSPTIEQRVGLTCWLQWADGQSKTDVANWGNCFNWEPCSHFTNGRCARV